MGRKVRITREMILQAAYEILDASGIGAVGIKAIASRLGCSTQPVSWVFGSMKELKKELFRYANARAFAGLPEQMTGKNAIDAFSLPESIIFPSPVIIRMSFASSLWTTRWTP